MNAHRTITWLERADRIGRGFETALLTLLFGALVLIAFAQIVLRNLFSAGWSWADGGTQVLVLWIAVAGALAATRDKRHIAINLTNRLLPPAVARWIDVAVNAFAATVTGIFAWHAYRFVSDSREFGDLLLGNVPAWWLQSILPIGFGLIAYRFSVHCLAGAIGRQ